MQTFLPYADFAESARVLDRQRLGKQRVENLQLMKAILLPDAGWSNHPAAKMWSDHVPALMEYQRAIVREWVEVRGYKDTCYDKTYDVMAAQSPEDEDKYFQTKLEYPWFVGNEDFHLAHRSNLVRKDPEYYIPIFGEIPDDLEYIWTNPDSVDQR